MSKCDECQHEYCRHQTKVCLTCEHKFEAKAKALTAGQKWVARCTDKYDCPLHGFWVSTECPHDNCVVCKPALALVFDIGQAKLQAEPAMTAEEWLLQRKLLWGYGVVERNNFSLENWKVVVERVVADYIELNKDKVIK